LIFRPSKANFLIFWLFTQPIGEKDFFRNKKHLHYFGTLVNKFKRNVFKPLHTLLFLIVTFICLGFIGFLFPKDGIYINHSLTLYFLNPKTILEDKQEAKTDISKILQLADETELALDSIYNESESTSITNSANSESKQNFKPKIHIPPPVDSTMALNTSIQYKSGQSPLSSFFDALLNIQNESKSVRVLHYGDSQIEGDRISDYLRLKLQNQFGGEGPGLISFMPVAPSVINKLSWSDGWDRYQIFSGKDKRVKHNNFGALAHITRFKDYSTTNDTTGYKTAWVKMVTSKNGGPKAAAYKKIKLFYGGARTKTHIELYENGSLNNSDSLVVGGIFNIKEFNLYQGALLHEFKFKGTDSPDFYGVSLEGDKGIMVDNMGLRGSSGTFFNQINSSQLKQFYDYLNVRLIILQYGGNSLPYITTKEQADNYAGYLKAQIVNLKKLAPKASILLIGPADMSVKVGIDYETHPQLENLRDAIKRTAYETNCAFFDMYNCMGGRNSMLAWVDQGIAAKDYIHFSPGGARKIAVLLHNAIMTDFYNYQKK